MGTWHHVPKEELPDEGHVRTVVVGGHACAISRWQNEIGALDNRCPHQGGPLGEGSIEEGWLRCPWHGYDYSPITGRPPAGFDDAPECFSVKVRDGEVYVEIPDAHAPVRTVADVVVETLTAWGVRHVFGMVGHSNLGMADAMRRAEERGDLTFIGIRHEGAASFAASAYGKLTGRPAACFAIAGPGSTNLLTGLYDAALDNSPVIAMSGQVPSPQRGRGAFQDLDLNGAFSDVALSSVTLDSASDHAELAASAVKHALDGRGVAHLVFPDDVQTLPSAQEAKGPEGRLADSAIRPPRSSVEAASEHLRTARRPVIIAGVGALEAQDQIASLAERLGAPVLTTFRAKGLLPDSHPCAGGVLGRSGTPVASWFMNKSDLLIVVGASASHHTGIAEYKPTIAINDAREHLGRFAAADVLIWGDSATTVDELLSGLGAAAADAEDQRPELADRWAIWREEKADRQAENRGAGVSAAAVFAELSRQAPSDCVFTVDVGNNAYSFGRYVESKGQPVLMSGYLGSIGFGYPAALGAAVARPDGMVIAVTGDGGFGQYLAEVTTAVKYGLNIKHLLLDNGRLGKIAKEQLAAEYPVWQTSLVNPDFAAYAQLCGAAGFFVSSSSDIADAMADWLDAEGPALLVVAQDPALV
jgi:thiamine pyrophosphate-dependent acetolactate synthase large subunit-like protein/nitrite reductase/ring-hydroxylating ferredoxin subunit